MPQKISKNTFIKGMNLDADISYQPQGTYREADEFRVTVDDTATFGTLTNVKGNLDLNLNFSSYYTMLGSIVVEDYIILFMHYYNVSGPTTYDCLYKITFNNETATKTLIYSDAGKADEDCLNFNSNSVIKGLSRKEAEDIEKIYWIDNDNYLRYANVFKHLTTDGEVKSSNNDYVSAKTFGTVSSVLFAEPLLKSSGGGGLNVGVVQYAYQLYNKNGSETSFSPATGLYHLSSSSDAGSSSSNYGGNKAEEESGKSLTFSINLSTYNYDSIRIVALHYEQYQQLPTINIINEMSIGSDGTVRFTDNGTGYLGSYTIEQFTALAGLYKAKDIASSKNYLFLANITENYFNIGDYDARAYRFNKGTTRKSRCVESNGDVYFVYTNGSWDKVESDGTPITNGTNWNLPESADLMNHYNNSTWDGPGRNDTLDTYLGNFRYDTVGLYGGEGKNILFRFESDSFDIDDNTHAYTLKTQKYADDFNGDTSVGFDGYYSPYNTANRRNYQRDETYRFGIVFFDQYGRQSVIKWIADIRMPNIEYYGIAKRISNDNRVYAVYPKFIINNYPEGAVAYKIVRLERKAEDKSIVFSGLLRPTGWSGPLNGNQPYHNCSTLTTPTLKTNLQEFISPEISFYKNFSVVSNDYLEVHNLTDGTGWDPERNTAITSESQDIVVKYRRVDYDNSYKTTTLFDGKVVGPLGIGESVTINSISFYPFFDEVSGEEYGYKGTSLILAGFNSNYWTYKTGSRHTDDVVKYALYRRHIHGSQYGGWAYSNRVNSEYIGCSGVTVIPSNKASTTTKATQGDMFINYMDHTALYYSSDFDKGVFINFLFPVESSINLALRHDDNFIKIYQSGTESYKNIREEGNVDYDYSKLYLYNTVYSQENNSKKYFPLSQGEDPVETKVFNNRVLVSEKKFNNEESDSWLNFLTSNFIDLDANYGELINIMDYSNNLLFWQPRAFGFVDVDPRSLITDNNPGALVLGTGAVLSRFDYLSTMTGNTDKFGLIKTVKGVYWYDNINETIVRYNGKSIERLSKLFGVQSWLNNKAYTTSYIAYDGKYDEVLFSLRGSSNDTLVFNEMLNAFTGFYGFNSIRYIQYKNRLISTHDNLNLYLHDAANSNYSTYYDIGTLNSNIKIPINSEIDKVKIFDGINYSSYSYNNSILNYENTFESVRCYNSYQNTDTITLTPGTNIERKKGMWSFHIPRNAVDKNPDTNPDIFNASNLNTSQTFKTRMRDTYMIMDLVYDNSSNYKFNVPFVHTKYRVNYR